MSLLAPAHIDRMKRILWIIDACLLLLALVLSARIVHAQLDASSGGDLSSSDDGAAVTTEDTSAGGDLYSNDGVQSDTSLADAPVVNSDSDVASGGDLLVNDQPAETATFIDTTAPSTIASQPESATGGDLYADNSSTGGDLYASGAPAQWASLGDGGKTSYSAPFSTGGDLYASGAPAAPRAPQYSASADLEESYSKKYTYAASESPPPKTPAPAVHAAPAPAPAAPKPASTAPPSPAPTPPAKEVPTVLPPVPSTPPAAESKASAAAAPTPAPAPPNTPAPKPQPERVSYGVDCQIWYSSIGKGPSVMLNWRTLNAATGFISPGIGKVNPISGSLAVYPSSGQMYSLTARGPGGAATCMTEPYEGPASTTAKAPPAAAPAEKSSARAHAAAPAAAYASSAAYASAGYEPTPTPTSASEKPIVSLTQVPYTGIDFDIAMPLFAMLIMLTITSTIVVVIYLLYRTGLLFSILWI